MATEAVTCRDKLEKLRTILRETMKAPFFPVDLTEVSVNLLFDDKCLGTFAIGSLSCESRDVAPHKRRKPASRCLYVLFARVTIVLRNDVGSEH